MIARSILTALTLLAVFHGSAAIDPANDGGLTGEYWLARVAGGYNTPAQKAADQADGAGTSSLLRSVRGLAASSTGAVYFSEDNHVVRKLQMTSNGQGTVKRYAGQFDQSGFSGDGGPATSSKLFMPTLLTVGATGDLFIYDQQNFCIRRVTGKGMMTTFAGTRKMRAFVAPDVKVTIVGGQLATTYDLGNIDYMTTDPQGNLYYRDNGAGYILKVDIATRLLTVFLGVGNPQKNWANGNPPPFNSDKMSVSTFYCGQNSDIPRFAIDAAGTFYYFDRDSKNFYKWVKGENELNRIDALGTFDRYNMQMTMDKDGVLYYTNGDDGFVYKYDPVANVKSTFIGGTNTMKTTSAPPKGDSNFDIVRANDYNNRYMQFTMDKNSGHFYTYSDFWNTLEAVYQGSFTAEPTATPTIRPSSVPTFAPSFASNEIAELTCSPYRASNTGNATHGTSVCRFIACEGYLVDISMCSADTYGYGQCDGDTFLRVTDAQGTLINKNNDYCGTCSSMNFIATGHCREYFIQQGCKDEKACGGTVAVTISNFVPTATPTIVPTVVPSQAPTFSSQLINSFKCDRFQVYETFNATKNTASCEFIACPGYEVRASMCEGEGYGGMIECVGDTYLNILDETHTVVASNDNYCGSCASIHFIPPGDRCQKFTIQEGCFGEGGCGGQVGVSVYWVVPSTAPTAMPSALPTMVPTAPTMEPTVLPTIVPTESPTTIPSYEPTYLQTVEPTEQPSYTPSAQPSSRPTMYVAPTDQA